MGFNTTIVVYNDALHAIENDPEFGKNLVRAIRNLNMPNPSSTDLSPPAGNHCNAAMVIEDHHADHQRAVLVGGNRGQVMGYAGNYRLDMDSEEDKKTILTNLADSMGYNIKLRKRPKRAGEKD